LLADAVAAFLDGITIERTFDEPFMALLRASGYSDVALVHGQSEWGKDFIAQRGGEQWAFQSKAGNLSLSTFRPICDQLYDLRMSDLSAPGFRTDLPRRGVLVLTGRLTGQAPLAAQEYQQQAAVRGEPSIEFWSKDTLVGKLSDNPDAVLRGSIDGQLMSLLGAVEESKSDMTSIEAFSRRWMSWEPSRIAGLGIMEAAVACGALARHRRLDLACHLALCMVRSAWMSSQSDTLRAAIADAASGIFETHSRALWEVSRPVEKWTTCAG
jgi:hypothetical protein